MSTKREDLRKRIARAIHEDDLARYPETFEWESSATNREAYYSSADAVLEDLGPELTAYLEDAILETHPDS